MKHYLYNAGCILALMLLLANHTNAREVRLYGYVVDTDNRGIEYASVVLHQPSQIANNTSTPIGTATNRNGYYQLVIPYQDTLTLTFSMMGYTTITHTILQPPDVLNVNVEMTSENQLLDEITVQAIKRQTSTMDYIEATTARVMPDATGGSIESLLITFAGVNQNNELSSQYNVRGGSFDENQVYVNGIEIHRPLLIRSGQQEGLSFVNPEMVKNLQFSAGGFDAQYGDKMASVLDITYKQPTHFEANIAAGLLGANLYIGHGNTHFSQMHGIRYKTAQYMLGALSTAGNYQPNFLDYQTYMTWKVPAENQRWTLSLLGNVSLNTYRFVPDSMSESFGGQNAKNLTIWYEGQEQDRFLTGFAAFGAHGQINENLQINFDLSGFYTNEQENYDISGEYILADQPIEGEHNSQKGEYISGDNTVVSNALGTGTYHQHARNTLQAGVVTLSHSGQWKQRGNTLKWGISGQAELINDYINEWEWRDSAGYSQPNNDVEMQLYYAMRGETTMRSARLQAYVQNTHQWNTSKGQVILTVGGRLQWWTFTNEVLPSPRASIVYIPGWKRDFSFRFATGLYYQAPFYKELRDTLTTNDGVTRIQLNHTLKAQRSVHILLGGDYYFRAWGRPFKLTAETYYKYIDRMETYTVDNVRVRYSGKNDAVGYAAGLDLKLYGELVPGADSWISFSTMTARQRLLDQPELGWIPSPQEQRYSFSMLFQDYIPQFPQLRFHIKMIWSDGMPFASPRNIASQKVFRMPDYRRIDIGATYVFNARTAKFMRAPSAKHIKEWAIQFEVFNLVGWKNVNSYFWVNDALGNQWASPNYLTGRRYNLKFTIDLK